MFFRSIEDIFCATKQFCVEQKLSIHETQRRSVGVVVFQGTSLFRTLPPQNYKRLVPLYTLQEIMGRKNIIKQ